MIDCGLHVDPTHTVEGADMEGIHAEAALGRMLQAVRQDGLPAFSLARLGWGPRAPGKRSMSPSAPQVWALRRISSNC